MLRSLGSFGSDLCEMQRFRDHNIAVTLKDAEWQRRILGSSTSNISQQNNNNNNNQNSFHFRKPPVQPSTSISQQQQQQTPITSQMDSLQQLQSIQPLTYLQQQQQQQSLYHDVITSNSQRTQQQLALDNNNNNNNNSNNQNDEQIITSPSTSPILKSQNSIPTSTTTSTATIKGVNSRHKIRSNRIGKIRRHRMTKEEEARFNNADLTDLTGSTAAKSRKMTNEERDVMLHKRRLRNRASAARSRDKQRKTIADLSDEMDELISKTYNLQTECENMKKIVLELRSENEKLRKENSNLKKNNLTTNSSTTKMRRNGSSTLKISMSSDMLDKLICPNQSNESKLTPNRTSSGLLRIPSKLHLSLSTDKLSDGLFPAISAPLSRNVSLMERLFDFNNGNPNGISTGITANDEEDNDNDIHSVSFPRNLG